ncbi:MAG: hypothetical protein HFG41_09000 [Coprococcus sp.]|nr:hypothetical protein [Coprococcus sp.]
MNLVKKAWLVRPYPHNKKRLDEFKTKNIVAVGWPGIGNLTGKSREELKDILSKAPYNLSGLALGNAYAIIDIFVNQMQTGDLVLVPDGDDIFFAEIISNYYHEPSVDNDTDGYPHQRTVIWLANTSRKQLTKELRSSLKVHRTTADLSRHSEEIDALAHGKLYKPADNTSGTVDISYPLRPNHVISFTIPTDMSQDEANRLSTYFASLYFVK